MAFAKDRVEQAHSFFISGLPMLFYYSFPNQSTADASTYYHNSLLDHLGRNSRSDIQARHHKITLGAH